MAHTLTGLSRGANLAIARNFRWNDYKRFVDVGTAQGDLAVQVALANPHLRGHGFDLVEVPPIFDSTLRGMCSRMPILKKPASKVLQPTTASFTLVASRAIIRVSSAKAPR